MVYNSTRNFLSDWSEIQTTSETIATVYRSDVERARGDNAVVTGIQLDLDMPDRLLPQYAQMLKKLRELLPPNTILSITGLPGWAFSKDIGDVLAEVDFWIPQCYGGSIPTRLSQQIPISSPADVARIISSVRKLGKPFYAGLSVYSYTILYSKDGTLLELRGDIDPTLAEHDPDLELIESQNYGSDAEPGEIRYVYRAKRDLVIDGLIVQTGESLLFDVPNAASLRLSARAVRENAGDRLLGICLFRLPTEADQATLSLSEIAAALADKKTTVKTAVSIRSDPDGLLTLFAKNNGTAGSKLSEDAFTIDLSIKPESIGNVSILNGFAHYQTLCSDSYIRTPRPCSPYRANIIRFSARSWNPGSAASVTFLNKGQLQSDLTAIVTSHLNDGRVERESFDLQIQK